MLNSSVLFIACISIGLVLAKHKPVWNDEIYSQTNSIEDTSYLEIIAGDVEEGNNSPLFYLMQKGFCELLKYKFPAGWKGRWSISDLKSQIILRINSIIFMSLSIVCIFFFFAKNYSVWSGIYSLFISISSYMVWIYWIEARPYPMWFFLITIQSLLFLNVARDFSNESSSFKLSKSVFSDFFHPIPIIKLRQ